MNPRPVCHLISVRLRRIEEAARRRLIEKFAGCEPADGGRAFVLTLGGDEHRLSRDDAAALHEALGEALTEKREFLRTTGEHREDGSYVVSRRTAESAGHRKVFDRFGALERLYERLPTEFVAADVGRSGLTGGRRHMVLRHFVEHPAFDCELASRQPLTARKRDATDREERTAEAPAGE